ncbi:MAG TPA: hypothetical protein VGP33_00300 [Chloroflexota bacterium]|jgi:hypothetical protein|nr:hypothetical protein [Chloroflexota bacterium]
MADQQSSQEQPSLQDLHIRLTELENTVKSLAAGPQQVPGIPTVCAPCQSCYVCYQCYHCYHCYQCRPICYECGGCGPCLPQVR